MLNGLALSRVASATAAGHHLVAQQQQHQLVNESAQPHHPSQSAIHLRDRTAAAAATATATSFAYPQLLNATRDRLAAGLPVVVAAAAAAIDPKNLRHNFSNHLYPSSLSSLSSSSSATNQHHQLKQSTTHLHQATNANNNVSGSIERDFSPMTYLRPMPPLIPVTVAAPLMAASPTRLRSFERLNGQSETSSGVGANLRDGSSPVHRGPPRKSSRFRAGEGSGSAGDNGGQSESSDSPTSSASSSPSLMTDVVIAVDGQTMPIADSLRSTSVIRFAHRPSASSSPTSPK